MTKYDRATEDIDAATGQTIVRMEGPAEIASWFFPNEPADDAQRIALQCAVEALLDKRIAAAVGAAQAPQQGSRPAASLDRAWRNYLEAVPASDTGAKHQDIRNAFYGGAKSALLMSNGGRLYT
jgi:hypothetical protein